MGQAIQSIAHNHDCLISHPIDLGDDPSPLIGQCDAVIDFSLRDATLPLANLAADHGKPMVIGTTGHENEEKEKITRLSERIPMVWAGNFSTGVNLLFFLTQKRLRFWTAKATLIPR